LNKNCDCKFCPGICDCPDFIYGDLNGDGEIDLADLMLLRRHLAGWENLGIDMRATDVNADGDIDLADLMLLRRKLAGWDIVFDPQCAPLVPCTI